MDTTLITIISSFVFLVLLWIVVGVRHLKGAKKTLDSSWEFVDEKIRKRHDLAPVLVECARSSGADSSFGELVEKMIPLRDAARRIYFPCTEKNEKEVAFGGVLKSMISYGEKSDVVKNTYFLEIKKEISDIDTDILNRSRDYNDVAAKYNKSLDNVLLKPLALVLKSRKAEVFNFS